MKLSAVILAAGEGKRMHTQQPKVIQPVSGVPMLTHVVNTAQQLAADQICIVHGYQGQVLKNLYRRNESLAIMWSEQKERLGTGHAVLQAMLHVPEDHYVLVLYGDVPLIRTKTLLRLLNMTLARNAGVGLLVANVQDPFGLGRIVRDPENYIEAIVEEKDASISEKNIQEIFTGILVARADLLKKYLPELSNDNAKREYYLTGLISICSKNNIEIASYTVEDPTEILGANTRQQLAVLERAYQIRLANTLMRRGNVERSRRH